MKEQFICLALFLFLSNVMIHSQADELAKIAEQGEQRLAFEESGRLRRRAAEEYHNQKFYELAIFNYNKAADNFKKAGLINQANEVEKGAGQVYEILAGKANDAREFQKATELYVEAAAHFMNGGYIDLSEEARQKAFKTDWTRHQPIGTGRTTGHIALIPITNKGGRALLISPQMIYIPSDGPHQSYIARIAETIVPPGATLSISVDGYCVDVHKPPVPDKSHMPLIDLWIPISDTNKKLKEGSVEIISAQNVNPFKADDIPDIITSSLYKATPKDTNSPILLTWPGTSIPLQGVMVADQNPHTYASLMNEVLLSIESATGQIQLVDSFATPFSSDYLKEREAFIQQVIWIYSSALTGVFYNKKGFAKKIDDQVEKYTGQNDSISTEQQQVIDVGIHKFWKAFMAIGNQAKIFNEFLASTSIHADSTEVSYGDTIPFPWSKITLTGSSMKPDYPFTAFNRAKIRWIPVVGSLAAVGAGGYFLVKEKERIPCPMASFLKSPDTCSLGKGRILVDLSNTDDYTFLWSDNSTKSILEHAKAGLLYTVTITQVSTQCKEVRINTVDNAISEINAFITTIDAHCGIDDGGAVLELYLPTSLSFDYLWSNGNTTSSIRNVAPGSYSVTVSFMGGCEKIYPAEIEEGPELFSLTFTSVPTICDSASGLAVITVNPPGNYDFLWPDGNTAAQASGLIAGQYIVTVTLSGTICSKVTTVTIEDITPPLNVVDNFYSTPNGAPLTENALTNDFGLAIKMTSVSNISGGEVTFSSDGQFTYTPDAGFSGIGFFTYIVTDQCGSTGSGAVTIQVLPAIGDFNKDTITNDLMLSYGPGLIYTSLNERDKEQSLSDRHPSLSVCLVSSLQYYIGTKSQEFRMAYVQNKHLALDYLSEIAGLRLKNTQFKLQGGVGITTLKHPSQQWVVRCAMDQGIGKSMQLQCSASIQGWQAIEKPSMDIVLMIVLPKTVKARH